jgi:cytochrome o ubiquinol oxidase subunit 2
MKRKIYFLFVLLTLLWTTIFLQGCSEIILFNPKGPIGESERSIILIAFGLMLIVVIPVIVMSIWFPLKYRASNPKASYDPNWSYSKRIETTMWLIPMAIVVLLSILAWRETHRLDPYRPIAANTKPLNVEVVSLDWKWLFIYPEQNIAVVNQLVFPAKVPLSFRITSDTVMTSFFIPQLGSQIYAMAGMQTRLHLMADEPGEFVGQNQQFSGAGFPFMKFSSIATTQEEFEAWVQQVRLSPEKLDFARLEELGKPGVSPSVITFSSIEPGLFEHIMSKYATMPRPSDGSGEPAPHPHGKEGAMEDR